MSERESRSGTNEAVSLAPLTPEEALRALLAVKRDDQSDASNDSSPGAEEPTTSR